MAVFPFIFVLCKPTQVFLKGSPFAVCLQGGPQGNHPSWSVPPFRHIHTQPTVPAKKRKRCFPAVYLLQPPKNWDTPTNKKKQKGCSCKNPIPTNTRSQKRNPPRRLTASTLEAVVAQLDTKGRSEDLATRASHPSRSRGGRDRHQGVPYGGGSKRGTPNGSLAGGKSGPKPVVCWRFHFGPYPFDQN